MGGSWASLGASRPPFGTLLASPLAIKILPESILWLPFVPKDLPREPKRAPGPPRDAFGDDFVLIFRCPEALQCALLRPTCALEIARSKRTCFRLCLHSTAIPNAHLKCFNSSPTIANQQYPSPSKGRAVTPAQPGQFWEREREGMRVRMRMQERERENENENENEVIE